MATYYVTTGVVTGGTVNGTETSIGYVWHPATVTKKLILRDIDVHGAAGNSGSYSMRVCKISAQHATPGGSEIVPVPASSLDAASGCTFVAGATGAPTRGVDMFCDMTSASADFDGDFEAVDGAQPPVIEAGVAGGFEVRIKVEATVTGGSKVAASFIWEEVG